MNATRAAFLGSYETAQPLLASSVLTERWNEQSCLEDFSVRGLAGHLVRCGISPIDYLRPPPPAGVSPVAAPDYYVQVLSAMGSDDHREVTGRGEQMAAVPDELLALHASTVDQLKEVLDVEAEDRILAVFQGVVMNLDDYLVTRICEILVHTDDLAVSLGMPTPEPPQEAYDLAIDHLVAVARGQQGDAAVLTGLSRRERDEIDALRVFRPVPG